MKRAALLLCVLAMTAAAAACPMCKDAITTSTAAGITASPATGFFYSILLMVSTPLVLMSGITVAIVRERRLT